MVSQHQGDLEDLSTYDDYEKNLDLYQQMYEHQPQLLVADKHPQYLSTQLARRMADESGDALKFMDVQHHHAHIGACMAENNLPREHGKVLGIAMDGLGFGEDGTIWGGEFLLADYLGFERLARFKPVAMIGGAQAIKAPWRNTYAHIVSAIGWQQFDEQYQGTDLHTFLSSQPLATMDQMLAKGVNVPLASSCGRLFDAVSAALGICRELAHFEGQGAIELEMQVNEAQLAEATPYPFELYHDNDGLMTIDPGPMWQALLGDLKTGSPSVTSPPASTQA